MTFAGGIAAQDGRPLPEFRTRSGAMALTNRAIGELLSEPREVLDVEIKDWLDPSNADHRAAVAKEIIALANHGGGYLVVGFSEQQDGSFVPAESRPSDLNGWSQDLVQSIIAKYVDPAFQCDVIHHAPQGSTDSFPVITVPGGHRVPIRARKGSPDGRLVAHRIYIRRPGPNSEEPRTAEDWDRLLERCLQNRREELLEAMRSIMAGVIPTAHQQSPSRLDALRAFEEEARERWESRVERLEPDTPPRFPHGHYDLGIAIDGSLDPPTMMGLRDTIATAVRNHTGWPPFATLDRAPFAPKVVEGAVEFWRGPEDNGSFDRPEHHDFWRASPEGLFFLRRGYQEDGGHYDDMEPGAFLDITTPTWRLGEAIMEVAYVAQALGVTEANLICDGCWVGLSGRKLISRGNPYRMFLGNYQAAQPTYEATETVALDALPGALPDIVFAMQAPLYELFDFHALPKRLVEEELATMLSHRF